MVGPHVFANTALYEIHYLPQQPASLHIASETLPFSTTSLQLNIAQTGGARPNPSQQTGVAPLWPAGSPTDSNPLSQSRLDEWVTPALLTQVTKAVETDPVLRNLLELAQKHQLTDEQRTSLTSILRMLNNQSEEQSDMSIDAHNTSRPTAQRALVQPFDLVLEFQERPSDRWLVPRGAIQLEDAYAYHGASRYDVIVSMSLPTLKTTIDRGESDDVGDQGTTEAVESVKLHWRGLPQVTYDILMAWSRAEPEAVDISGNSRYVSVGTHV